MMNKSDFAQLAAQTGSQPSYAVARSTTRRGLVTFTVELAQEVDGRWIGEGPKPAGAMVYGTTREKAAPRAKALVLRVLADRLDHSEDHFAPDAINFVAG